MIQKENSAARPADVARTVYVVRLRPEAGMSEDQATRGLRALLKAALRLHGFRCLSAEPESADDSSAAEASR